MHRAMKSAALDDRARRELTVEWERHRRELGAIRTGQTERFLREFDQHMDCVNAILLALHQRLAAP